MPPGNDERCVLRPEQQDGRLPLNRARDTVLTRGGLRVRGSLLPADGASGCCHIDLLLTVVARHKDGSGSI